ncbi:MAM and LDL-receptor class A domain-containing protein 2-like protein, partial [Leptotrombidium deliense]
MKSLVKIEILILFISLPFVVTLKVNETERCSKDEFDCNTKDKFCIPKIYVCDFTDDCPNELDENVNCTKSVCTFHNGDKFGWIFNNDTNNGKFKWNITNAANVSKSSSLPKKDTTTKTGDGFYAYILGVKGLTKAENRISTNFISRTAAECSLGFHYYCDLHQCPLQVIKTFPNGSESLIWDPFDQIMFDNSDEKWRKSIVYIGNNENFKISFVARQHYDSSFVIALDDLHFENCNLPKFTEFDGKCDSKSKFRCQNGHCIDRELICDFSNDCLDNSDEINDECKKRIGNCDFESVCHFWSNDNSTHDMFLKTTKNSLINVAQTDHTTRSKNGTFLSSRSMRRSGDYYQDPRIISKIISGDSKSCHLRFWSNIIGDNKQNVINVYKKFDSQENKLIEKIHSEDVYDFWSKSEIDLKDERNEDFEVVIEAIVRRIGSVSIDDISFSSGCQFKNEEFTSKPLTTIAMKTTIAILETTTTTSSLHHCPLGTLPCDKVERCFTLQQRCNFKDDCGDNTDEENCGFECDFESSCRWFTDPTNIAEWVNHSGPSINRKNNTGPLSDHTFGNNSGHYMVTDGPYYVWNKSTSRIQFESPYFQNAGKTCKFQFYYHMYGQNMGTLNV